MSEPIMIKTYHPIQRAGTYGFLMLAQTCLEKDVERVEDLTYEDVSQTRDSLTEYLLNAAMTKGTPKAKGDEPAPPKEKPNGRRKLWNIYMAHYPNSPIIQPSRPTDKTLMKQQIVDMLAGDDASAPFSYLCFYCDRPAQKRWLKSHLPLASADNFNTSQDGETGTPVCFGCRLAMWSVPFAASHASGCMTVATTDDELFELRYSIENFKKIQSVYVGGTEETKFRIFQSIAVDILKEGYGDYTDLPLSFWSFKNDNREAFVNSFDSVSHLARFFSSVMRDVSARQGYHLLAHMMTSKGDTQTGYDYMNTHFFNHTYLTDTKAPDKLIRRAYRLIVAVLTGKKQLDSSQLANIMAFVRFYQKEVLGMHDNKALETISDLIVKWIAATPNPRSRYISYMRESTKGTRSFSRFLINAQYALYRDGETLYAGKDDVQDIIEGGETARTLLFFSVTEKLLEQGIAISQSGGDGDDEAEREVLELLSEDASTTNEGE